MPQRADDFLALQIHDLDGPGVVGRGQQGPGVAERQAASALSTLLQHHAKQLCISACPTARPLGQPQQHHTQGSLCPVSLWGLVQLNLSQRC